MTYRFLPKAEDDLNDAIEYYGRCQKGLGTVFLIEAHKTLERILQYPNSWSEISSNCPRCLTNRFPYEIIYSIEENAIIVLAVASQHRHPDFWKNR